MNQDIFDLLSQSVTYQPKRRKLSGRQKVQIEDYLADFMRNVLSPYCLNECTSSCCEFYGDISLGLNDPEFQYFFGKENWDEKWIELNDRGQIKRTRLGENLLKNMTCPMYDPASKRCTIHESSLRPRGCREFPLSIDYAIGDVTLDARCPYIARNWEELIPEFRPLVQRTLTFHVIAKSFSELYRYDVERNYHLISKLVRAMEDIS